MKKLLATAFRLGLVRDHEELHKLKRLFPHMAEDLQLEYRQGQKKNHYRLRNAA